MNQERFNYTILSWNVRGLGLKEKFDAVRDTISISHPHIACLQESKLHSLDVAKCKAFLPAYLNAFTYAPADGARGGLVTAWNPDFVSAMDIAQSTYCLTVSFASTSSNYSFFVTNVYAPSDHRETDLFLADLESIAQPTDVNWVAIGDYNLTREPADKNNGIFDQSLADKFNASINRLALLELPLLDRLYTWSNRRDTPILARLDRALVNNAFASSFPNSTLTSRLGSTSDHVPLILTIPTATPKSHRFHLENAWLKCPGF